MNIIHGEPSPIARAREEDGRLADRLALHHRRKAELTTSDVRLLPQSCPLRKMLEGVVQCCSQTRAVST
jgi:hypothetical protein